VAWWSELLTTNHEVPGSISGLPWEFSLAVGDPHSEQGLGSLKNLVSRLLLVLHAHTFHYHSHYPGNVTAPHGRPKLRSQLHFGHNQEGGPRSLYGHVVALEKRIHLDECLTLRFDFISHNFPEEVGKIMIHTRQDCWSLAGICTANLSTSNHFDVIPLYSPFLFIKQ
jgi:hypothetical protein